MWARRGANGGRKGRKAKRSIHLQVEAQIPHYIVDELYLFSSLSWWDWKCARMSRCRRWRDGDRFSIDQLGGLKGSIVIALRKKKKWKKAAAATRKLNIPQCPWGGYVNSLSLSTSRPFAFIYRPTEIYKRNLISILLPPPPLKKKK